MRHRIAHHAKHQEKTEINLSPMIDMVFILLIFFIVTTVFVEESGLSVNKPDHGSPNPMENKTVLIQVTAENKVIYQGNEIGVSGVIPLVKRLVQGEDIPVIIQTHKNASHGMFARVYGEAKYAAGAKEVKFATQN